MHNKTKPNFIFLLLLIFNISFIKSKDSATATIKLTISPSSSFTSIPTTYTDKNGFIRQIPQDAREREKLRKKLNEDWSPKNQYEDDLQFDYTNPPRSYENPKEYKKRLKNEKAQALKLQAKQKDEEKARTIKLQAINLQLQAKQKAEELKRAEEASRKLYLSNFCQNLSTQEKQPTINFSKQQLTPEAIKQRQTEWIIQEAKIQSDLDIKQKQFRIKQNHYLNYLNKISEKQNRTNNNEGIINEFESHPPLNYSDYFELSDLSPKKVVSRESFHKISSYRELKNLFDCQENFKKIETTSKNNSLEQRLSHLGQEFINSAEQELFNGTAHVYQKYTKRVNAINDAFSNS